jgi:A/G-specific adenine glycosylase
VVGRVGSYRRSPDAHWVRRRVLSWFHRSGREFPWRESSDPYAVLIAEVLLQRTRADLVEPIFRQFIAAYPDARALAHADPAAVFDVLRPLGFVQRSARLPELGRALVEQHSGAVPRSFSGLVGLPGVGRYVANAVLVVAFEERRPLVDPNVLRVLERAFGFRSTRPRPRDDEKVWAFVGELLPHRAAREFNLALVDLGAVVCRVRRPRCGECPLNPRCRALQEGEVTPWDGNIEERKGDDMLREDARCVADPDAKRPLGT